MKAAEKSAITSYWKSQYGSVKCYWQLSQVSSEFVAAAAQQQKKKKKKKKENRKKKWKKK